MPVGANNEFDFVRDDPSSTSAPAPTDFDIRSETFKYNDEPPVPVSVAYTPRGEAMSQDWEENHEDIFWGWWFESK